MKNQSGLGKFTSSSAELGVHYHTDALNNEYVYDNLLFVQMINGKKEIDLHDGGSFEIGAEELLLTTTSVAATVRCKDAGLECPTVCMTLEVDNQKVGDILDRINDRYGIQEMMNEECDLLDFNRYDIQKSQALSEVLHKIQELHLADSKFKDRLVDIAIEELVVKTLQTDFSAKLLQNFTLHLSRNPMSFAVEYIRNNIHTRISIDDLANQVYMSRATFYRQFKICFGISPLAFIKTERIKQSCRELVHSQRSIASISYDLGYTTPSYFVKQFKDLMKVSPQEYRLQNKVK